MWTGLSHGRRSDFNSSHLCLTSKCHTSLAQSQHKTGHHNIYLILCNASAPYYQYEAHGCACQHWATDTVFADARPWGTDTGDWYYFLTVRVCADLSPLLALLHLVVWDKWHLSFSIMQWVRWPVWDYVLYAKGILLKRDAGKDTLLHTDNLWLKMIIKPLLLLFADLRHASFHFYMHQGRKWRKCLKTTFVHYYVLSFSDFDCHSVWFISLSFSICCYKINW